MVPTQSESARMPEDGVGRRPVGNVTAEGRITTGVWGPTRLTGPARITLTSDSVQVEALPENSMTVPLTELTGVSWRTGTLSLHGLSGRIILESHEGLESLFVSLVSRSCPLPEFTRSFRRLGSIRGGHLAAQDRLLAPLLQARRQLESEGDLVRRVELLDARQLRVRFGDALDAIAAEASNGSAPERRGLRAELEEMLEPLFRALQRLEDTAERFRAADDSVRFSAWRTWVDAASEVFLCADRGWAGVARLLQPEGSK